MSTFCVSALAIRRNISSACSATATRGSSAPCAAPNAPPSSNARFAGRLKAFAFDGVVATPRVETAVSEAELVLVSIPPNENGDPVLAAFGDALTHARGLRSIVYLLDRRRLRRPRRRVGRRRNAAATGHATRPRTLGRRASLARSRRAAEASPSPSCGSPASMDRTERARPDRTRQCAARRQARPGLQPHPCRRHCPSDRCGVHATGVGHFQRRR